MAKARRKKDRRSRRKQARRKSNRFDFANAVVGQPGPDGTPIVDTFTMRDGTPGVETRTENGERCFTLPLSAIRRKPVVTITPPPQPESAAEPKRRPARVAQMLALANDLQDKLDRGEYSDQATAARKMGISRSRLTRLLDLALLAPDIQEEVLFLEAVDGREPVTERALREVVRHIDLNDQRRIWRQLGQSAVRMTAMSG